LVRECQRNVNCRSSQRYLSESGVRPLRTIKKKARRGTHTLPLSTYTAQGACGKTRVVPHNHWPKREPAEMGTAKWVCCRRRIRPERGYDRACGGDRRRRADRPDVGGRVGVGGGRRRHRRAAGHPGPPGLARRRFALTHHRDPRSAWDRRAVPIGGAGGPGPGFRLQPLGHQRLSHPAQLRARTVAEPHRADPRRVGRRAR
jgi:hypothetical protein